MFGGQAYTNTGRSIPNGDVHPPEPEGRSIVHIYPRLERAIAAVGVAEFAVGYALATHGSSLFPAADQGSGHSVHDPVLGVVVFGVLWCATMFGVVGSWVCAGAWAARVLPSGRAHGLVWRSARIPLLGAVWLLIALGAWVVYDALVLFGAVARVGRGSLVADD